MYVKLEQDLWSYQSNYSNIDHRGTDVGHRGTDVGHRGTDVGHSGTNGTEWSTLDNKEFPQITHYKDTFKTHD